MGRRAGVGLQPHAHAHTHITGITQGSRYRRAPKSAAAASVPALCPASSALLPAAAPAGGGGEGARQPRPPSGSAALTATASARPRSDAGNVAAAAAATAALSERGREGGRRPRWWAGGGEGRRGLQQAGWVWGGIGRWPTNTEHAPPLPTRPFLSPSEALTCGTQPEAGLGWGKRPRSKKNRGQKDRAEYVPPPGLRCPPQIDLTPRVLPILPRMLCCQWVSVPSSQQKAKSAPFAFLPPPPRCYSSMPSKTQPG